MVQTALLQNSHSGSDSGIKETKSLCEPHLINCGCFPIDVWPEPLERATCSSRICPLSARDAGLQSPQPGAALQLRGSSGSHPEPLSPTAQEGGREWYSVPGKPVRVCTPRGSCRQTACWGCRLMCLRCKVWKLLVNTHVQGKIWFLLYWARPKDVLKS